MSVMGYPPFPLTFFLLTFHDGGEGGYPPFPLRKNLSKIGQKLCFLGFGFRSGIGYPLGSAYQATFETLTSSLVFVSPHQAAAALHGKEDSSCPPGWVGCLKWFLLAIPSTPSSSSSLLSSSSSSSLSKAHLLTSSASLMPCLSAITLKKAITFFATNIHIKLMETVFKTNNNSRNKFLSLPNTLYLQA